MKRETVKAYSRFVIGFCVGTTASQIIANNVTPEDKHRRLNQVKYAVGGFVIGSMAAKASENWVNHTVDVVYDALANIKQTMESLPEFEVPV